MPRNYLASKLIEFSRRASIQPDLELSFTPLFVWGILGLDLILDLLIDFAASEPFTESLFLLFHELSARRLFSFKL